MAYKLSIGVTIDPSGAKSGGAQAQQAVAAIGAEAQSAAPKVAAIGTAADSVTPKITAIGTASTATAPKVAAIGTAAGQADTQLQRLIATSTGLHSGSTNDNVRRWNGLLADEAMSIDNLRAKYNPLFAVIQRYQQAKIEIRTANAMGALSSDEMTAALQRERQATLASIDAIKGRNAAVVQASRTGVGGTSNHNVSNVAAQGFDIITTAPFMPISTVALQQGPQLVQALEQIKASGQSVGKTLFAAFTSLVSPMSLVTIGLVAAGAAAIQYFTSTGSDAKKAEDALSRHSELIARIRQAWPEALAGAKEYAAESDKILRQDVVDSIAAYKKALSEAAGDARSPLLSIPATDYHGATETIRQVQSAIALLDTSVKSGDPNLKGFIDRLIDIQNASGTPENIRALIIEIREAAKAGLDAQGKLNQAASAINGIGAAAAQQTERVKALAATLQSLSKIGLPSLDDAGLAAQIRDQALKGSQGATEAGVRAIEDAYQASLARIEKYNPTVINSDGARVNVPAPGARPNIELEGLPGADKIDKAARSASNAYRDLIKSADDRVAQMKLEAQLAGETGVASDALRFKLDLLQQSEDKGRSLSSKQVEAINARVEAFKKYAEEAAKAKLQADLLFDREQLGRSSFDQQIASTLRGAGLPVDFDSYEAGIIRTNLQLQYARDLVGGFSDTLWSSLEQGKSLWESLGDAAVSSLKKIADTLLNDVLNSLFQVNSAASGGGGGGLLGGILSLFGGGQMGIAMNGGVGLYDRGGYTGPGGVHEAAGVVHRGEVVFSQADVRRNGGVAAVDAIRLGRPWFAAGGAVGVQPLMSAGRFRQARSATSASGGQTTFQLNATVSGNGDKELQARLQQSAEELMRNALDQFSRQVLPTRVSEIQNDPYAVG